MINKILILVLLTCWSAPAATRYIKPGGSGSGTSWADALGNIPTSPASLSIGRGHIYYIASGDYNTTVILEVPYDGTNTIIFRKATATEHGTDTGWQASYGVGPATWRAYWRIFSGYLDFDGVTGGGPGSWDSGHGFRMLLPAGQPSNEDGWQIQVGDKNGLASEHVNITNVFIRHMQFGPDVNQHVLGVGSGIKFNDPSTIYAGILMEYCFSRFNYAPISLDYAYDSTVQKTYINGNSSHTESFHSSGIQMFGRSRNIIRWNWIENILGTAWIGMYEPYVGPIYVYGNVFYGSPGSTGVAGRGVVSTLTQCTRPINVNGARIYNNTFVNTVGTAGLVDFWCCESGVPCFSGVNIAENNLFYRPNASNGDVISNVSNHDYNQFTPGVSTLGEPNATSGLGDPFVNWQTKDVRLTAATIAGRTLSTPYDVDMFGNTRGADGVWDRGAIEFLGNCTNAPTITSATTLSGTNGLPLSYTITTTCLATNFGANNLPTGLTRSGSIISGTLNVVSPPATNVVLLSATNVYGFAQTNLTITIAAPDLTAPSTPTGVVAVASGSTFIDLSWYPSTDANGVSYYRVFKGGVFLATSTGTNYTASGLSPETAYTFTVSAVDGSGNESSQSSSAGATTLSGPNIPTGLQIWFMGSSVEQSGGAVSKMVDQSGNLHDATQATSANQPTYIANAINSNAAIRFDGLNDYLSFTYPVNNLTEMSIFMLANNTTNQTGGTSQAEHPAVCWLETASWGTVYLSPWQATVNGRFGFGTSGSQMAHTRAANVSTNFNITGVIKNGTTAYLYTNGVVAVTLTGQGSSIVNCQDAGNLGLGYQSTYFAGHIAEVLVYNRALNATEILLVQEYLAGKYFSIPPAPDAPSPDFSGTPLLGTNSLTVIFDNETAGPFTNGLWTFGDGLTTNTTALSVSHSYTNAGTFDVTLRVIGNGITNSVTSNSYVTVISTASTQTVNVATVDSAGEPSVLGLVRFSRSNNFIPSPPGPDPLLPILEPLLVNFSVSGTATSGVDYFTTGNSFTFPQGNVDYQLLIVPIDDSVGELEETVVVTIEPGSGYVIGTNSSATVTLTSDDRANTKVRGTKAVIRGGLRIR